jgi:hypothetical protein
VMAANTRITNEHVGELLSGYIDGELTQQQRQRVDHHCDSCTACATELEDLKVLRRQIGGAQLSEYGEDTWRETMNDATVQATRGLLAIGGIGVYEFITDPSLELYLKLIIGAIYGGFAALFISVLRQRLIERKADKYKDVEI